MTAPDVVYAFMLIGLGVLMDRAAIDVHEQVKKEQQAYTLTPGFSCAVIRRQCPEPKVATKLKWKKT